MKSSSRMELPEVALSQSEITRQIWMGVLATAPSDRLAALWETVPDKPDFTYLRAPEFGLVMTQGRIGGVGAAFNLGEMTVTRCSLRLADGTVGHAWLGGRDKVKARIAALLDAMLQQPQRRSALLSAIIRPLQEERMARDIARAEKVAATRVEFFTMVRGEN